VIARGTPLYATLEIPFLQVAPERATPLYDLDLYREVDMLIVSSAVRERYRNEPQRFAQPCAFYDSLDRRFVRQARFEPLGSSGSALTIYTNPSITTPFAARPVGPAAVPAPTGGTRNPAVGFFHFNQGVNDECFGFPDQAVESYRLALRQGDVSPEDAALTRARIGHCLLARGPQAAIAYLDTAAVAAPDPLERETLGSLRTALQERPAAFAGDALPDLRTTLTKQP
jgi:hypothetical protein